MDCKTILAELKKTHCDDDDDEKDPGAEGDAW